METLENSDKIPKYNYENSASNCHLKLPVCVAMLGPSLQQQGGMAGVQNLIIDNISTDVKVTHISTHEEGSISRKIYIFVKAVLLLSRGILAKRIDVIHIHIAEKGSVLRKSLIVLLGVLYRLPIILHAHGSEFHLFYDPLPQIFKEVIGFIFRRCNRFIVLSESWKTYYAISCGLDVSKIVVLANPVEIPKEVPTRPFSAQVNFVFLGRIGKRKGAFDLLYAYANLPEHQRTKSSLTLAGDGEVEQANQLIEELKLGHSVKILGWVNPTQRSELLRKADVFILPSYNEGLPLAILEAMAWGLPIITTPIGGIPEIVKNEESGLLVEPGNQKQIAGAMEYLINDSDKRSALGIQARLQVAPLDVSIYCGTLYQIYQLTVLREDSRAEEPHL